jgi:hypothetical protein
MAYLRPELLPPLLQALTTSDTSEQARLLRDLLGMQCSNALMHESVHVSLPWRCTRPVFEWANAMLVVTVEQLLGEDCEVPAEEARLRDVVKREWWRGMMDGVGGVANLMSYERREASLLHVP